MARGIQRNGAWLCTALLIVLLAGACGGKKRPAQDSSIEPDKVLFDRASEDIRKGRHTVARLTLNTLINTYPDSEYLAKAKLAICESYYKEGGSSGLAQAAIECKDFKTFFPFLEEAAHAQMIIAMSHYRRMEKPDRDRTYARHAEEEFQRFLIEFQNSPQAADAEQRLREVQEVLAEGDFRIGLFYYRRGSLRASGARLLDLVSRYPLYSQSDRALWMLGDIYERSERAEIAGRYYARIVSEYPLSPLVEDAKQKLVALGIPVPQPNPEALERMQKEKELQNQRGGLVGRALGMLRTGPDVSSAARSGKPNLEPPAEPVSPTQTLTPSPGGGQGGNLGIGVVTPGGAPPFTGTTNPPSDGNSQPSTDPAVKPEKPAESSSSAAPPNATDKNRKKAEEEKKKKEEEAKKKAAKEKEKESSSKKKKGLRRIIPW